MNNEFVIHLEEVARSAKITQPFVRKIIESSDLKIEVRPNGRRYITINGFIKIKKLIHARRELRMLPSWKRGRLK